MVMCGVGGKIYVMVVLFMCVDVEYGLCLWVLSFDFFDFDWKFICFCECCGFDCFFVIEFGEVVVVFGY